MATHQTGCACGCMPMIPPGMDRRRFLGFATAGAVGLALAPRLAHAQAAQQAQPAKAASPYKAMLLSCVDPRTQAPVADWMGRPVPASHAGSLQGQYSQFTIAGAAVGVIAPAFKAWRETFWENFGASIQLHKIRNLVAVDHGNCGALGIAYGQDVLNNPKLELQAHMNDVTELQRELGLRHPEIAFQAWYVTRDNAGAFTVWKNLVAAPVID